MVRAAVLQELNAPLVIEDLQIPDLEIGQVLVEIYRAGICGAQLGEISGAKGEDKYLPHLLGHEGSGIVMGVGPGVTKVQERDMVILHWRKGNGIGSAPPKYERADGSFVGGGWVTTFSTQAIISENRLTPVAAHTPFEHLVNPISFEHAALLGCSVTTALGLINNEAKLKMGETILITGCGGVGLSVVRAAVMVSAGFVVAADIYPHKLEWAKEAGADRLIDMNVGGALSGAQGVDVFVDTTGVPEVIDMGYSQVKTNGRAILVGQPPIDQDLVLRRMRRNYNGKVLMDSQGGLTNPTEDIPRYIGLHQSGKLNLDDVITHRMGLDDINEGIRLIKAGEVGKCILILR